MQGPAYWGNSFTVGTPPYVQVQLNSSSGIGTILFIMNNANFSNAVLSGSTSLGFGQVVLNGPAYTGGLPDFVGIEWNSNTGSGSANLQFVYTDIDGDSHLYAAMSDEGFVIAAGAITAVNPDTGTNTDPASPETWHAALLTNGWTGSGSGVNGVYYRLKADSNEVEVLVDVINSTATGSSVCAGFATEYYPAANHNQVAGWNNPQSSDAASAPWFYVSTSGTLTIAGIEVADKEIFGRIVYPLGSL